MAFPGGSVVTSPREWLKKQGVSYLAVYVVKVSSKGQIVIPKEVRKRHRAERDTKLVLTESGDALVLRKQADVEPLLKDEFTPLLRASEQALKGPWDNPEDDVWNDR